MGGGIHNWQQGAGLVLLLGLIFGSYVMEIQDTMDPNPGSSPVVHGLNGDAEPARRALKRNADYGASAEAKPVSSWTANESSHASDFPLAPALIAGLFGLGIAGLGVGGAVVLWPRDEAEAEAELA